MFEFWIARGVSWQQTQQLDNQFYKMNVNNRLKLTTTYKLKQQSSMLNNKFKQQIETSSSVQTQMEFKRSQAWKI